ncbi:MAG: hypothetical protein OHK0052_20850 [Anaerolineales bacterium]
MIRKPLTNSEVFALEQKLALTFPPVLPHPEFQAALYQKLMQAPLPTAIEKRQQRVRYGLITAIGIYSGLMMFLTLARGIISAFGVAKAVQTLRAETRQKKMPPVLQAGA